MVMSKEIKKTGYDWCLERNTRLLCLGEWLTSNPELSPEDSYYTELIPLHIFLKKIDRCVVKYNSVPRKTEKYLELRMYTLVPYNILSIQKGIQHEHSNTSYVVDNLIKSTTMDEKYVRWATEWKTSIILNGGTSNEGHMVRQGFKDEWYVGTMQQHLATLKDIGVKVATFYEPDLNSMLTGISFIVDERVFKKDLYPSYVSTPFPWGSEYIPTPEEHNRWVQENTNNYEKWCERMGGKTNVLLREFLAPLKLA